MRHGFHYFSVVLFPLQLVLSSALAVGQKCKITRIISGCDYTDDGKPPPAEMLTHPPGHGDTIISLDEAKKSVYPNFNLHVTPTFEGAKAYPWLNKPQGIEHWVANNPDLQNEVGTISCSM